MSLSHQKFREIVLQMLYSLDLGTSDEAVLIELMMGQLAVSKKNVREALEKAHAVMDRFSETDPLITSVSTSYDFDRIQTVTKNILRLGVYELFFEKQTPPLAPEIAIAEAIRLSRKFSSPESASFVNALLDQLYQKSLGRTPSQKLIEQEAEKMVEGEKHAVEKALEENQKMHEDDPEQV